MVDPLDLRPGEIMVVLPCKKIPTDGVVAADQRIARLKPPATR
ncbi:MAG: hypothetical protein QNL12_09085 [Acidimicrobiia bacterium]|nr:hypothetical protein [Acidimicrobiia bacterium]MDX2467456.1 hypothetical protein [Acidimicrobiia bacterium]